MTEILFAKKSDATAGNVQSNLDDHEADATNPHSVTKTQVGLGNVSDALQVINTSGVPSMEADLFANRPAAGSAGRIFVGTDTQTFYRDTGSSWQTIGGGSGDMLASTYDPQSISGDAFDRANHTGTEPDGAISQSSVTQHEAALTITESQISDLDHTDADAIHDNVAGEINAISEKLTPVEADYVLIEDSENTFNKRKVEVGNLPGVNQAVSINSQSGASYTLVLADAFVYVRMTSSSANTVTVPTNASVAYEIGTSIYVFQAGSGQTSIAGDTGVTVNTPDTLNLRTQFSSAVLTKVATDTWDLAGDLEA